MQCVISIFRVIMLGLGFFLVKKAFLPFPWEEMGFYSEEKPGVT